MLNSPRIIVTAGSAYTDIDALACSVAYAELLRLMGRDAVSVLEAPLNSTISNTMRSWTLNFKTKYIANPLDQFVLVDISNPEHFEKFVNRERIIQVFDHHYGFETFWKERLKENSVIEEVGSCATLIWEQFKKFGKSDQISTLSANLVYCSIISNTLNLKASITKTRDLQAMQELKHYIDLPSNWTDIYYSEVENKIIEDPIAAIQLDTKRLLIKSTNLTIAQLELWNADELLQSKDFISNVLNLMKSEGSYWFLTIANIKSGYNYIVTSSLQMQQILTDTLSIKYEGNVGITDKLFLRKELIKILMHCEIDFRELI